MVKRTFLLGILVLASVFSQQIAAQKMTVGTKPAPPFVMEAEDGSLSGITVDYWKDIAKALALDYELRVYDLEGLLEAVEKGEVDVAASPLTVTGEREERFDFSQPYFITGLGIAALTKGDQGFISALTRFISVDFIEVVALLMLLLLAVGVVVWLFERKRNADQFGGSVPEGLGAGFWFAAVTMTTVGYGDKAPVTPGGKIVALIWMFTGLIVISSFTAAITTALTVTQLDTAINSVEDLYNAHTGTVAGSAAEEFLNGRAIRYSTYPTIEELMSALESGKLDAAVYDEPILKYSIKSKNLGSQLKVIPVPDETQYYAFGFPAGSELREQVNRVLLNRLAAGAWTEIRTGYLGK